MSDPFLSRVRLGLEITRGFNDTYITHQLISDLFGDREDRGFLYRVTDTDRRQVECLVLSRDRPEWPASGRAWGRLLDLETRPYDTSLQPGQVVDYEVRINATRVRTEASGKKKRLDVWDAVFADDAGTDLDQASVYGAYLDRRLDDTASLEGCHVMARGRQKAVRQGRRPISFVAANLIGSLTVHDPDRFKALLAEGVGRSKAFGCGLLCLSRPGTILKRQYSAGTGP